MSATEERLLFLSVLTIGEIRKGIAGLEQGRRRTRLETWLDVGLHTRFAGRILPIDTGVADRWGVIAARAQRNGLPLPVIDGLLAATAQHHSLTVVSRNTADFERTGVSVVNPWITGD